MIFPVKSHLPLITTRIEFQLKELPPPPQITPRRDLGAHLRRQARRNSVPYSRHMPYSRPSKEAAVNRSVSPLSDISESEKSDEESRDISEKIPKPIGEPGRSNSGGYNLKRALGWEENRYNEFNVSYICQISRKIVTITTDIYQRYNHKKTGSKAVLQ
jgi:hypothetical protein